MSNKSTKKSTVRNNSQKTQQTLSILDEIGNSEHQSGSVGSLSVQDSEDSQIPGNIISVRDLGVNTNADNVSRDSQGVLDTLSIDNADQFIDDEKNEKIIDNLEQEDDKKFRMEAKQFAITYSKCYLSKDQIESKLRTKGPIEHFVIAHELHKDGTPHIHVYVNYCNKKNFKNCRVFDIGNYHPNLSTVRSPLNWYNYVKKETNYIEKVEFDNMSQNNFIKRKNDFEAFKDDLYKRQLDWTPINELSFNGITYKNEGKKRHLLIVSDPDWGKSTWLNNTFKGKAVFKAANNRYPMDDYENEQIIIFDDFIPKNSLLLNISDIHHIRTCIGDTRFKNKYFLNGQQRWIIIMLNTLPSYSEYENFQARFNIIDLRTNKEPPENEFNLQIGIHQFKYTKLDK